MIIVFVLACSVKLGISKVKAKDTNMVYQAGPLKLTSNAGDFKGKGE